VIDFLKGVLPLLTRSDRRRLAALFGLMGIQALLELLSIALVLPAIDILMTPDHVGKYPPVVSFLEFAGVSGSGATSVVLGVGLVLAFTAKNLLLLFALWTFHRTAQGLLNQFRLRLLSGYLHQSYSLSVRQNSSDVLRNLFTAASIIYQNGVYGVLTVVLEGLIVGSMAIALLAIEPRGALVAGAIVAVTAGAALFYTRLHVVDWGRRHNYLLARMMQTVNEALATYKEIRLRNCERHFIDTFGRDADQTVLLRVKLAFTGVAARPLGEVVLILAVAAVIATLTLQDGTTVVSLVPVLTVFAVAGIRIMPSAARIVAAVNLVREARGPLETVLHDYRAFSSDMALVAEQASGPALQLRDSLAIENVSFRYQESSNPSLTGVTLSINPGQTVAVIGSTGAGKTTLIDLILGLLEPTSGRITVDGVDIRSDLARWQKGIGHVPQSVRLLDDSLRRNIAFGVADSEIDDDQIWRVAKIAQLDEFVESLPQKMDTTVGERGARLSGGQLQRVGIARALYTEPEILVMDEATSALDVMTEHQFGEAIEIAKGNRTVIIIAHRLSTVRKCDNVFVLDEGRLVASGTFDEIVARLPRIAAMVSLDRVH